MPAIVVDLGALLFCSSNIAAAVRVLSASSASLAAASNVFSAAVRVLSASSASPLHLGSHGQVQVGRLRRCLRHLLLSLREREPREEMPPSLTSPPTHSSSPRTPPPSATLVRARSHGQVQVGRWQQLLRRPPSSSAAAASSPPPSDSAPRCAARPSSPSLPAAVVVVARRQRLPRFFLHLDAYVL